MALVNGGFLLYTDIKKFLKNLVLRNRWSDFEIISQESGFDMSRHEHPDCPIRTSGLPDSGCNCYRQAALTICEPTGQVKFLICYHQFGSFLQIPVVFGL